MYTLQDWNKASGAYEIIDMARKILGPRADNDMFLRATDRIFCGIEFGDDPEEVSAAVKAIFNDAVIAKLSEEK